MGCSPVTVPHWQGYVRGELGQFAEAAQALEKSLELNHPNSDMVAMNLGHRCCVCVCVCVCARARNLPPGSPSSPSRFPSASYEELRDFNRALDAYSRALKGNPNALPALVWAFNCSARTHQTSPHAPPPYPPPPFSSPSPNSSPSSLPPPHPPTLF